MISWQLWNIFNVTQANLLTHHWIAAGVICLQVSADSSGKKNRMAQSLKSHWQEGHLVHEWLQWTTKTTCFGHLDSESISLDYYNITILLTLFCVLFCFLSTSNCRRSFNIKLGARQWVGTSLWVWLPELAVCPGRKIFFLLYWSLLV